MIHKQKRIVHCIIVVCFERFVALITLIIAGYCYKWHTFLKRKRLAFVYIEGKPKVSQNKKSPSFS